MHLNERCLDARSRQASLQVPPGVIFGRRAKVCEHVQLLAEIRRQICVAEEWLGRVGLQETDDVSIWRETRVQPREFIGGHSLVSASAAASRSKLG